jgi:putative ABC transport system ATP-binding protein
MSDFLIRFANTGLLHKPAHTVNINIKSGEKVFLNGPSGSGKTSLIKMLLGFAQPPQGTVYFENRKICAKTIWEIRRRISYIPQDTTLKRGTVENIIKTVGALKSNRQLRFDREKIANLVTFWNLPHKILTADTANLSGGEKQRVLLLIATLLERPVIILDEVTANLDAGNASRVYEYFFSKKETTVLAVSHDKSRFTGLKARTYDLKEQKWTTL